MARPAQTVGCCEGVGCQSRQRARRHLPLLALKCDSPRRSRRFHCVVAHVLHGFGRCLHDRLGDQQLVRCLRSHGRLRSPARRLHLCRRLLAPPAKSLQGAPQCLRKHAPVSLRRRVALSVAAAPPRPRRVWSASLARSRDRCGGGRQRRPDRVCREPKRRHRTPASRGARGSDLIRS